MLLQIFWTIVIDSISYSKTIRHLVFINTHYIFSNIDKDKYLSK